MTFRGNFRAYPRLLNNTLPAVAEALRGIIGDRIEDLTTFNNLDQEFLGGRTTQRVPSSNSDVIAGDKLHDVVNDATFEYKLLDISGTLKWDRRTLDTAW